MMSARLEQTEVFTGEVEAAPAEPTSTGGSSEAPQALARREDQLPAWGIGDSWLAEYERIAVRISKSITLPAALEKDARNVLAVALAGRELGLGFFESMRHIHIINGQTALSSEIKMALAKRSGVVVDAVDASPMGCTITAHRSDTGESVTATFTEEDKSRAGLGKSNSGKRTGWDNYPEDMYYARAAARLIRRLAPDAKGASFRSVEELTDEAPNDGTY